MTMLRLLFILAIFEVTVGNKQEYSDEYYNLLPQYTQLDDYNECLSGNNGLYCFGTFRIHPNLNDSKTYEFIMEHSTRPLNFDRTIFYRGYCVTTRCPFDPNTTKRFKNCVQGWASNYLHTTTNLALESSNPSSRKSLNTSLENLHYCRAQKKNAILDTPSQIFLLVIFLVILANVTGTIVDFTTEDKTKSKLWSSWSLRSNWKQFVGLFGTDPDMTSLASMQIIRVIMMAVVIFVHVIVILIGSYLESPQLIEKTAKISFIISLKRMSVVQVFFAMSNFLTAYNLLLLSKRQSIGLWMLPKQFLKRYFRIAPVHLLTVGFAATLWPLLFDGPMWSAKVDSESTICRTKIWYHVLHIQNLVDPCKFCLPQSWSIAVDIQLQFVSLVLTLTLAQYNLPRLKILLTLFISSCALIVGLGYVYSWKPFMVMALELNIADTIHQDISYVSHYYMTPWGSLPACLIGLIMAHIYFRLRQQGIQIYKNKWLHLICRYSLPFMVLWILAGYFAQDLKSPILMALCFGMERPVFTIIACIWLFGMINGVIIYPGFNELSWRVIMMLGRLNLPVLLVHWMVITTRVFSQSQPVQVSWWHVITEFLASWSLSYLLALPITLLVELPMQNTFTFLSSLNFKTYKKYQHATKILYRKEMEILLKQD